jgi:uncharacterized protein (DUF302 family)
MTELAYSRETPDDLERAEARLEAELKLRGFGILSVIPIHRILKEKLGLDRPPLVILEVCSPKQASEALERSVEASLLLPCKIVLTREGDRTRLMVQRPVSMIQAMLPGRSLETVARESERDLMAAVDAAATGVPPPA